LKYFDYLYIIYLYTECWGLWQTHGVAVLVGFEDLDMNEFSVRILTGTLERPMQLLLEVMAHMKRYVTVSILSSPPSRLAVKEDVPCKYVYYFLFDLICIQERIVLECTVISAKSFHSVIVI